MTEALPGLLILFLIIFLSSYAKQKKAKQAADKVAAESARKNAIEEAAASAAHDRHAEPDPFSHEDLERRSEQHFRSAFEPPIAPIEDRLYDEGEDPCHEGMLTPRMQDAPKEPVQEAPAALSPVLSSPGALLSGIMLTEILQKPLALRGEDNE